MWEDAYNRSGGRWSINLGKAQRAAELDKYWMFTVRKTTDTLVMPDFLFQLLSLIGDQYTDDAPQVNGCVVSVRSKGDRISLWTKEWKQTEVTKRIG